jgi:glutamate-1-semialdehyde 2,1-aminomutase
MSTPGDFMQAYSARRPKSVQYYQRARQVLAGGVGHDLRHFEPVPLYIARAHGGRKWDVDGNEYVDFLLGNGAMLLGHADPEICEAVSRAVRDGSHFGNDHPLHIEWAEWVCRLVPSAERVRFVNSGTEATHLALRLARAYAGKPEVLRFEGHFHGWHDEVVHGFQPPFDSDGTMGAAPHARGNLVMIPDGDLELLEKTLRQNPDIAAAIVEPSGASWGRVPITAEFLRGLRELTQRFGVVLIFDEVVTGFRFSPGGVQQSAGVTPDLTCLAKVLAGGMPGGAVAGRAEIMKLFDQTGDPRHDRHERVVHQGTFNGAPPCAAAGVVALRRISAGEPIREADRLAEALRGAWDQVLERHGIAGYVYGPASTFHVYFETNPQRLAGKTSRRDLVTSDARLLKGMPGTLINQYQRHLRFRGVDIMSSTGGVLSCAHTEEDIRTATAAFEEAVAALRQEGLIRTL